MFFQSCPKLPPSLTCVSHLTVAARNFVHSVSDFFFSCLSFGCTSNFLSLDRSHWNGKPCFFVTKPTSLMCLPYGNMIGRRLSDSFICFLFVASILIWSLTWRKVQSGYPQNLRAFSTCASSSSLSWLSEIRDWLLAKSVPPHSVYAQSVGVNWSSDIG